MSDESPEPNFDELFVASIDRLRRLAQNHPLRDGARTLQPTAVVNEVWMRLQKKGDAHEGDQEKFLANATTAMRRLLVDYYRRKKTERRGGDREREPLEFVTAYYEEQGVDIPGLDEALTALERNMPEEARVAELKFFGGLSMDAISNAVGVPKRTIERRWKAARVFLHQRLGSSGVDE